MFRNINLDCAGLQAQSSFGTTDRRSTTPPTIIIPNAGVWSVPRSLATCRTNRGLRLRVKNILFIMADQLRADYLSCYGHPTMKTANIDSLASRGVLFSRAYAQATVCGPSRMSFYTGRYMSSHGSTWNGVPLRVGEITIGDHLRGQGLRVAL